MEKKRRHKTEAEGRMNSIGEFIDDLLGISANPTAGKILVFTLFLLLL